MTRYPGEDIVKKKTLHKKFISELLFSVVLCFTVCSGSTLAYEDTGGETDQSGQHGVSPSFAMLLSPGGILVNLAFGILAIEPDFQFAFSPYLALDVIPGFAYYFGDWVWEDVDLWGGGAAVGLRIMPMGTGLRGLYIVPRLGTLYMQGESPNRSLETLILTPSAEVGYSWLFGNFIMNLGGGVGYAVAVYGDDIFENRPLRGFMLLANFSLGFAI